MKYLGLHHHPYLPSTKSFCQYLVLAVTLMKLVVWSGIENEVPPGSINSNCNTCFWFPDIKTIDGAPGIFELFESCLNTFSYCFLTSSRSLPRLSLVPDPPIDLAYCNVSYFCWGIGFHALASMDHTVLHISLLPECHQFHAGGNGFLTTHSTALTLVLCEHFC